MKTKTVSMDRLGTVGVEIFQRTNPPRPIQRRSAEAAATESTVPQAHEAGEMKRPVAEPAEPPVVEAAKSAAPEAALSEEGVRLQAFISRKQKAFLKQVSRALDDNGATRANESMVLRDILEFVVDAKVDFSTVMAEGDVYRRLRAQLKREG